MEPNQVITIVVAAIGVLIAGGGLVVSIISLRRSSANEAQSRRLQEKQEELAEIQIQLHRQQLTQFEKENSEYSKADIRVVLEGVAPQAKFKIHNWGLGAASNINIDIRSPTGRDKPIISDESLSKLPIKRLAPGASIGLSTYLTWGTGTSFEVCWSWENDDGTKSEENSSISL